MTEEDQDSGPMAMAGGLGALWHNATTSYPLCLSVNSRP